MNTNTDLALNRWLRGGLFPDAPPFRTAPFGWVHQLAVASLLLYSVSALALDRDLVRVFELLAVLAMLASLPWVIRVRPNAVLLGLLLALVGWMLWVDHSIPAVPEDLNVAKFERLYARQFLFLVAGWWIAASLANARVLVLAGVVGCLAGLAVESALADWGHAFTGRREDFGFHNAQHTALYFGSVLLALPALVAPIRNCRRPRLRLAAFAVLAGVGLLCVLILGATQTRQTWVALIPAGITVLAVLRLGYGMRPRWRGRAFVGVIVAAVAVLAMVNPWQGAWQRTASELDEIASLIDPDTPAESSSITIRLSQWRFALETIAERPLVGHGGGMTGKLLQQSDAPAYARGGPDQAHAGFGHVHNGYLEMAIHYGLVGLLLWLAALGVLLRQALAALCAGRLDPGFAAFALAWPVYFLAVNLFESFIRYDSSSYVVFVFAGAIYGATLVGRGGDNQPVHRADSRSEGPRRTETPKAPNTRR